VAAAYHRFMGSMADPFAWIFRWWFLGVPFLFLPLLGSVVHAQTGVGGLPSGSDSLDVTAERIDYRQDQEVYDATGSVVIRQGKMKLTADHVTIQTLPGILTAIGHVHLMDPQADVTAERMEMSIPRPASRRTGSSTFRLPIRSSQDG
jgi:LPS-assembly protein